jgi:hypothetical protein
MTPFHFRLQKVLDWYRKQCEIEEERLRLAAERTAQSKLALERHQRDVLARQMELIHSPQPQAYELAALGPFCRMAKQREVQLRQKWRKTEQELDHQRAVAQASQRRVRLVENLRDRRLSEYQYQADRELEELASEAYLAGFARRLNNKSTA